MQLCICSLAGCLVGWLVGSFVINTVGKEPNTLLIVLQRDERRMRAVTLGAQYLVQHIVPGDVPVPGTWYLAPGTRYLVPGAVPGTVDCTTGLPIIYYRLQHLAIDQ